MPDIQRKHKAGKLSFLLVCLFLCTACRNEKTVFEAGKSPTANVRAEEFTENFAETEKAPEKKETEKEITEPKEEPPVARMVNINTADAQELMTLPGIGQVRADAIIEYRQSVGKFEQIEDIMNVKGIKTGTFEKIGSLICVK